MNTLIWIAIVLFILWVVLKFVFALAGAIFHLLWIVAVILFIVWLIKKVL